MKESFKEKSFLLFLLCFCSLSFSQITNINTKLLILHKRIPNDIDCITSAPRINVNEIQGTPCSNVFRLRPDNLPDIVANNVYNWNGNSFNLIKNEIDVNSDKFPLGGISGCYDIAGGNTVCSVYNFSGFGLGQSGSFGTAIGRTYALSLHLNQPISNERGNCDDFILDKSDVIFNDTDIGTSADVQFEYTTDITNPSSFVTLDPLAFLYYDNDIGANIFGKYQFNINDLPGLNNYSGNFYVRYKININDGLPGVPNPLITTNTYYSNIINYSIKKCTPKIIQTFPIQDLSCSDSNNGELRVKFDRALEPSEYIIYTLFKNGVPQVSNPINNLDSNNEYVFTNLNSGSYSITNFQSTYNGDLSLYNVSAGLSFTITAPPPIQITSTTKIDNICKEGTAGKITVNATGGTGALQYNINNGPWQTNNVFENLATGSYSVLVKDANECIIPAGAQIINITEPATKITITTPTPSSITYPIYFGNNTSTIDAEVNGGTGAHTYSWAYSGSYAVNTNAAQFQTLSLSNLYAGTYTLTATDANGCLDTKDFIVFEPTDFIIGINVDEPIKCFGESAQLSAIASGSILNGIQPAYVYEWSKNGTVISSNQTISGAQITPGTYRLRVTVPSQSLAFKTIEYILTQPTPISISLAASGNTSVNCFGGNDGSITINVSGGTPFSNPLQPYTYLWSNGATTKDISGLTAGNYSVIVTDANNCNKQSVNFTVFQPTNALFFSSTAVITSLLDAGVNNGAINISVSGGTPFSNPSQPYTYLWSNGAINQDISGLTTGTYSVTVTDANNCSITGNFIITAPPVFSINVFEETSINCNGQNTGKLRVDATGGTPNYTYVWTSIAGAGIPFGQDNTLNYIENLPAGTYKVVVKDNNNISRTQNYVLSEPNLLTTNGIATNITCVGLNNGAINFTVNGGTMPYSYLWNNGATTEDLTNLSAGSYSCLVTDSKGCTITSSNFVISNAIPITITVQITPISVVGASDGQINATVTGGVSPYFYYWTFNGSSLTTTSNGIITGLQAGIYDLIVTDANGCTKSDSFVVQTLQPLAETATIQNVSCFGGSNGTIIVNPTGGIPPYNYVWSNPLLTGNFLTGLQAGTYNVTITDSNPNPTANSTFFASYNVTQPISALSYLSNTEQITCYGLNNGSINLTISGGTAPYSYAWSNGAVTEDLVNLSAGSYSCIVTDSKNCTMPVSAIVILPVTELLVSQNSVSNVTIFGGSNGAINVNVTGGTAPYAYLWNNGAITQNISGLTAGTYSLVVTDSKGCTKPLVVTISQPQLLQATINTITPISCFGESNGSLTAIIFGGVAPFIVTWSLPNNTTQIGTQINNLFAGTYVANILDANGATTSQTFTLDNPTAITASFISTPVSCGGGLDGNISIFPNGGTAPYTYQWNNGSNQSALFNVAAGVYNVLVKDSNGCEQFFTSSVAAGGGIQITETIQHVTCGNSCNGSIALQVSGGSNNYSITWNNASLSGFTNNNLCGGTYTGTITDNINSCTIPFSYFVNEPQLVNLSLGNDIVLCNNQNTTLNGTISIPNAIYSWTSTNGFTSNSPIVTLNQSGIYTLTVQTQNCVYTDNIQITTSSIQINANYLVVTQTYKNEEIILINVTERNGETFEWIIPSVAQIISQNDESVVLKFPEIGSYNIGLKATNSTGCSVIDNKQLIIEESTGIPSTNTNNSIVIKSFVLYPNPIQNQNNFNVNAILSQELPLNISIYNVATGALVYYQDSVAAYVHNKSILANFNSGVYYVIIKTPGSIQAKKLIIQ